MRPDSLHSYSEPRSLSVRRAALVHPSPSHSLSWLSFSYFFFHHLLYQPCPPFPSFFPPLFFSSFVDSSLFLAPLLDDPAFFFSLSRCSFLSPRSLSLVLCSSASTMSRHRS